MNELIPVTVLTGYLGSGKTTVLNHLLSKPHGQKIAVIENEFGEIGVDQDLVIQAEEEIFEMSNGCVCCSVRGDLVRILLDLSKRKNRFDRIVLETTGVADPAPVIQTFLADPQIKKFYQLDAVVTMVDAMYFPIQGNRSPEARRQVTFADRLVITKPDLVSNEEMNSLREMLARLNPRAGVQVAERGNVDWNELLGLRSLSVESIEKEFAPKKTQFSLRPAPVAAVHETDVQSVSVEVTEAEGNAWVLDYWLNAFTRERGADLYRLKGVLAIKGELNKKVFQGVHSMLDITEGKEWKPDEQRRSVLVAIGKNLDAKLIEETFRQCFRS